MESDPSSRKRAVAMGFFVMAGIAMLLLQWLIAVNNTVDTIPFSQFEQLVSQDSVTEVSVTQDTIQGKLKDKLPSGKSAFVTARVDPRWPKSWRQKASPSPACHPADCSRRYCPGWLPDIRLLPDLDLS